MLTPITRTLYSSRVFGSSPPEAAFTSYVAGLAPRVRSRLGELLEIDAHHLSRWVLSTGDDQNDKRLEVVLGPIENPLLELDIISVGPDTRAWFKGENVALSYRKSRDGSDPFTDSDRRKDLEKIRNRLQSLDSLGWESGPLQAFCEAVEEEAKFRAVSDVMYRQMRPRELVIRLGFRCNQDCAFCWQDRDWPEPPSEYYHTWLDEAAQTGQKVVFFSGGEPTIHRELPLLMARSRDYGMAVWLQTNAMLLGKPAFMKKMKDSGLSGVFVSYHSHDAEISDHMTRAPKTHALTERGIAACLDHGVLVTLNCVVERPNYDTLAEQAQHIVDTFNKPFATNPVKHICYSHPHSGPTGTVEHVDFEEIRPHLTRAIRILLSAGIAVEAIGTCGFPPCVVRDTPEVFQWFDPSEEHDGDVSGRGYGEVCGTCKAKSRCLGVRNEYLERFGELGLVPFKKKPWARFLGRW